MTGTDLIFGNAVVSALGWALVHFLWQGCVIAAAYWLVCAVSRQESAHLRYWAGITGFFLSIAAMLVTFTIYYKPAAQFALASPQHESVNPFLVLSGSAPDFWTVLQDGIEPALPMLVLVWLTGVLLHSLHTVCGWVGIRRLVVEASPDIGDEFQAVIANLLQVMQIRRVVRVLKSTRVSVPMAIGWLRPVILLPASVLANLPRDQLEMVVAHELGHIKRFDFLFNLLQIVAETVLFYHPAIGWMSRRVREERENCCDDLVVSRCRKPATYARALANLEIIRSPMMAAALTATGGDLVGRIKRIIDSELPRSPSAWLQITLLGLMALAVGVGTHQGMLMSRALNEVAGTARLAPSDIEWKTRGQSRSAWGEGVMKYAGSLRQEAEVRADPEAAGRLAASASAGSDPALNAGNPEEMPAISPRTSIAQPAPTQVLTESALVSRSAPPADDSLISAASVPVPVPLLVSDTADLPQTPAGPAKVELAADHADHSTAPSRIYQPISTTKPRYPWRARKEGVEGFVELAFSVDAKGEVTDIEVLDSIPSGTFERAARKALKKWKFEPREEGASTTRLVQTFDFNLEELAEHRKPFRSCVTTGHRTCSRLPSRAIVVYVNPPAQNASFKHSN